MQLWFRLLISICQDVILLPLAGVLLMYAWIDKYRWSSKQQSKAAIQTNPRPKLGVLLLHGSGFNRTQWLFGRAWLWWNLFDKDQVVLAIDYAGLVTNHPEHGIDSYARGPVRQQLLELKQQTGIRSWVLVGHSMGSLIGAYYTEHLSQADDIQIVRVISISSPWQGAPFLSSRFKHLLHTNSGSLPRRYEQMSCNSSFLIDLSQTINRNRSGKLYLMYGSEVDIFVPGRHWCWQPTGHSVPTLQFAWSGHYSILIHPLLWSSITAQIKAEVQQR